MERRLAAKCCVRIRLAPVHREREWGKWCFHYLLVVVQYVCVREDRQALSFPLQCGEFYIHIPLRLIKFRQGDLQLVGNVSDRGHLIYAAHFLLFAVKELCLKKQSYILNYSYCDIY